MELIGGKNTDGRIASDTTAKIASRKLDIAQKHAA
jgi:hypothetical protein